MTALVAGTVERTFSGCRQKSTGLSRSEPNHAGGQNLDDFGESLGRRHQVGTDGIHRRSIALQGPGADQSSDGFGLLIVCGQPMGAARIPAVLCVSQIRFDSTNKRT